MQHVLMFIDYGQGWKPLNNHDNDVAALTDFTIRWGLDNIDDEPTPAVLNFTLVDRTGTLAGNPTILAGARVCVQIGRIPTYNDIDDATGTYAEHSEHIRDWYKLARQPLPSSATSDAFTIFYGLCSTGGTISRFKKAYKIKLQASSTMILWKRLSDQGPTSSELAFEGKHWVNSSGSERFNQLAERAHKAGAPPVEATGVSFPASVAPYDANSFPSYLTLLSKLTNHLPELYVWCETPSGETSTLRPYPLMGTVGLSLDTTGKLGTIVDGTYIDALPANRIEIDEETLTIPSPVTQITISAQKADRDSSNKLTFSETDVSYTAPSLPENLKTVQATMSRESDAIAVSTAGTFTTWQPTGQQKSQAENNIIALNTRILPSALIFDSTRLDPAIYTDLYITRPSQIYITSRTMWEVFESAQNPWRVIGGTLTYKYVSSTPRLKHKATITSVALDESHLTYNDLHAVTASYADMSTVSLNTFSKISRIRIGE